MPLPDTSESHREQSAFEREADAVRLNPDLELVESITAWGGSDVKICYQCATCSVVCPLSPEENPFPRKEMLWAQWGLRERLIADPDLWLCHRCNDCSDRCPRGAKTGDVMAALRCYATQEQSWPRFLGRALNRPLLLPLLFALPTFCIFAIIELGGTLSPPGGEVSGLHSTFFGKMIEPWPWLDLTFLLASTFAMLSFGVGVARFWRGFSASGVQGDLAPKVELARAVILALSDSVAHRKFKTCGAAHARGGAHLLIMCGFCGLFLTTALVFLGMVVGPLVGLGLRTPLPLGHWIKVLGNASAISIAVGLVVAIARRLDPGQAVRSPYQDVLFLAAMALTVVTGILSEVLRLATLDGLAYSAYFLHLTFILFLILFAPFSKFAHVVYHATALAWAYRSGRLRVTDKDRPTHRARGA